MQLNGAGERIHDARQNGKIDKDQDSVESATKGRVPLRPAFSFSALATPARGRKGGSRRVGCSGLLSLGYTSQPPIPRTFGATGARRDPPEREEIAVVRHRR
ncbi:MAG: hypothetical protein NVS9B1_27760 [Candidatus Dormibacteraceae bacterium]